MIKVIPLPFPALSCMTFMGVECPEHGQILYADGLPSWAPFSFDRLCTYGQHPGTVNEMREWRI